MNTYLSVLKKTVLFSGVKENEIEAMLSCLQMRRQSCKKGEYVDTYQRKTPYPAG